ncbi:GNAT family N-acetyltransferase [Luteimonas mephitis]|uniref:GNAT family N-acetyltransferase n=1 Tax=Luteimonas mephitis TaxID=83615 RepID=UPI003A921795
MFAKPDLRVAPVKPELVEALRALRVAPGQQTFVGDTGFNLDDAMRDPNSEAMAIVVGATPVGFYRLDFAPTIVARRSIGEAGIGLRAFFLDAGWQGRGLGTRAVQACCEDLQARHPDRHLLALNVDCRNVAAINAYRKAGFVDTGELCLGGSAGPQHLMVRRL